jgi:hypothetical protein
MAEKLKKTLIKVSIFLPLFLAIPGAAYASIPGDTNSGDSSSDSTGTNSQTICDGPDLTTNQQLSCQHCKNTTDNGALNDCLQHNVIIQDIQDIVNFLSAAVGIVVIGTLILGGIQYSMAGGSPDAVSKAKQRMTNGAIAFVAFLFIFAFLQWIIPGGIFSSS